MNFPVFDLHCDTAFAMLDNGSGNKSLRCNDLHIDLCRAGDLPGYAQCFACFTSDVTTLPLGTTPEVLFGKELECITTAFNTNSDVIKKAYTADEVVRNYNNALMSGILSIEGPAGFRYAPDALKGLYDIGFRITTLGWNEQNILCGSHITGGGLTEQGREYVNEAQRLGMIVDVSHCSDEAFWDIISITKQPIIASHSNSRAVWNVSRNLTDDMFIAICKSGGVVGINLYADFLGHNPNLDTVCDHIEHFLSIDSEGKHIALGGDLDGCDRLPSGFRGVQDYPKLADRLLERGLHEMTVYDIFWNNAIGVMEHCCT